MAEYIERKKLIEFACRHIDGKLDANDIARFPTTDVVPVVRCKDCKYCVDMGMSGLWCEHDDNRNPCGCRPDDFCNNGERRADNG